MRRWRRPRWRSVSLRVVPETAARIGDRQVRNCGTMGGSVAHADPGADYPTVLKALGATISATGRNGEREVAADDFFRGMFATAPEPGELVTSVKVPATDLWDWSRVPEARASRLRYAVVGVAALVTVVNGNCTSARLTVGGLTALRWMRRSSRSSAAPAPRRRSPQPPGRCRCRSRRRGRPAAGEYRKHLATVLAKRVLREAFRAGRVT